MSTIFDIAVLGGGAAGLMAAIAAGRSSSSKRIAILDGAKSLGAKILVSGGGRCNVTHDVVTVDDFNSTSDPQSNRNRIAKVLRSFPVDPTVAFFEDLGVNLKREETGKLFPVTDSARTVLDALIDAAESAGVTILTEHRVTDVTHDGTGFTLATSQGLITTGKLILATGGKSLPKTGSDGVGYELAKSLGHTIVPTQPALVPLVTKASHWGQDLSGLSCETEMSVATSSGKVIARQRGSMLFTHFGVSGPVVLDISRHYIALQQSDPGARLSISFVPGKLFEDVEASLIKSVRTKARASLETILTAHLPGRLARLLCEGELNIDSATPIGRISREDRRRLVHALTALPLPVTTNRGWSHAEVTAGGLPLAEVNVATMESRVRPGLFLCGEILDVDGRMGGYNFQWAWCTGRLAGESASRA